MADQQPPHSSSNPSNPSSSFPGPSSDRQSHPCQWLDCDKSMSDAETLYNHLCNDHIGRKSTGNLCLTCKWKDCGTTCAKRDHITSHLRVHTPLKPHVCEVCNKPFKRPQDLKKHEKIHTEEHHAQHKHSKAITVSDPAFSSRVRGDGKPETISSVPAKPKVSANTSLSTSNVRAEVPIARAKSGSVSLSDDHLSLPDFGVLPTPSPELQQSPIQYTAPESHDTYRMQPSWEVLRSDGSSDNVPTGGKRSFEAYAVDDFFTDVKKRRVNPSYDPNMVERLSTLQSLNSTTSLSHSTIQHPQAPPHGQRFPPRSVSFDIRSPEELAAVNEFLITLGRDITGNAVPRTAQDYPQSYFDAASLSQLGLAGMPGVPSVNAPGSGASYHGDSGVYASPPSMMNQMPNGYPNRSVHPSASQMQYGSGGMYPSLANAGPPVHGFPHRRVPSGDHDAYPNIHHPGPGRTLPSFFQPTPTHLLSPHSLESNVSGGASPYSTHSTRSTPPINTPPQLSESLAAFDSLMPSRAPPVIQLAPMDYQSQTRRTMVPLMTVPTRSAVESKWNATERGPPAKLTSSASAPLIPPSSSPLSLRSSSSSLYPLLTSGDAEFTLPPLQHKYRSPSPSDSSSPPPRPRTSLSPSSTAMSVDEDECDSSSHSSTPTPPPTLPPIRAFRASSERESDRLASQVGRIALESSNRKTEGSEQRAIHAELLRDMLVSINREYRRRYGTPPPISSLPPASPPATQQLQQPKRVTLTGPGVRGSMEPSLRRMEMDVEMVAA
ncbi:hypothetical protein BC835DRAFT_1292265 [Cytidiella melzeri]|nr:hypothetical protein BC835DRAFT_1292265 [Cytidiella melzeri]